MPKKKKTKDSGKKEPEEIRLTEGSQYEIQSIGSKDKPMVTKGRFCGFTMVGNHGEAICVELDKSHKKLAGKTRVIPTHMLLSIDILKEAKPEKEEEEDSASRSYM